MKSMIKYIILLISMSLLIGCSQTDNSADNAADTSDSLNLPDSESFDATIHLYNKERQTAEIIASRILKYNVLDSTIAYDLDVNIFDSSKHVTTEITGDSGIIRDNEHTIRIYGNVELVTENGAKLETDYLWWDYRTDRIKSDAFVRVTRDESVVTGWGLDADKKLNSIKILDRVSGKISDIENISP